MVEEKPASQKYILRGVYTVGLLGCSISQMALTISTQSTAKMFTDHGFRNMIYLTKYIIPNDYLNLVLNSRGRFSLSPAAAVTYSSAEE